jgi:hypothetical protein
MGASLICSYYSFRMEGLVEFKFAALGKEEKLGKDGRKS